MNKILKLFLVLLFCIMSVSNIYSTINQDDNNARAYYNFSNAGLDATGRFATITATGTPNQVTGIIGDAYNYDGSENFDVASLPVSSFPFTFNIWLKTNSSSGSQGVMAIGESGGNNDYFGIYTESGNITLTARNGATGLNSITGTQASNNTWFMATAVFVSDTDRRLYVNGVNIDNDTTSTALGASVDQFAIGQNADNQADQFFTGITDEASVWNKSLSQSEITQLYNGGLGFGWNFVNTSTPTISANISGGDIFDHRNVSVSLSAPGSVNMSVSLNGSAFTLLAINATSHNTTFNFSEGSNAVSIKGVDVNGVSYNNFTVAVDTTNPSLNVTAFTEFNNGYTFNWTNGIVNYSDTNLDTCEVTTDESKTFLCTNTSYTFSTNGNHTFNVSVNDTAGNSVSSNNNVIYFNPIQYFNFNNSVTGSLLSAYEIETSNGTYSVSGTTAEIPLFDFGYGNFTFNFTKTGYNNETFNVTFNNTSALNLTTEIDPVTLTMRMYDADSTTTQLTFNVTILNGSESKVFTNQLNLSETYTNIPTGDIELIVESDGYSKAFFYNTITQYSSLTIIGYLINSNNTDVVTFSVTDRTTSEALSNVTIEAQQLFNGTYTTISQAQTGSTGETFMFLDILQDYKFIFTKDGYVQATAKAIPGTTTYEVSLNPSTETFDFIDGVSSYFTPSNSILYGGSNYTFQGFISGTDISFMTYTLEFSNGTDIYTINSSNPTGTTFNYDINDLNASLYSQGINQSIRYVRSGVTRTVYKSYSVTDLNNESFIYFLKYDFKNEDTEEDNIFRWLIMICAIGASLLGGRAIGANLLGNSLIVVAVTGFFAYIEWMPAIYFTAISFVAIVIWLGGMFK